MKYIKLFENINQLDASNLEMCFDGLIDLGINVDVEFQKHKGQKWAKVHIYKFCEEGASNFDSYILIPGKYSNTKIGFQYYKIDNNIVEEIISSIGRANDFGFTKMEKISIVTVESFYEFKGVDSLYKIKNKQIQTISILYYL